METGSQQMKSQQQISFKSYRGAKAVYTLGSTAVALVVMWLTGLASLGTLVIMAVMNVSSFALNDKDIEFIDGATEDDADKMNEGTLFLAQCMGVTAGISAQIDFGMPVLSFFLGLFALKLSERAFAPWLVIPNELTDEEEGD